MLLFSYSKLENNEGRKETKAVKKTWLLNIILLVLEEATSFWSVKKASLLYQDDAVVKLSYDL